MFYFLRVLALLCPFLFIYILAISIRFFFHTWRISQDIKEITNHLFKAIEICCFHPMIRKIAILCMLSATLPCFEDDISSSNWMFLKYTCFYVFCFSQTFPSFGFFHSTNFNSKRLILEVMIKQSKIWLQITTILTIVISLTSLFAEHASWLKLIVKVLNASIKTPTWIASVTFILLFSIIADFSLYIGTNFYLYTLEHQVYKAEK